MSDFMNNLNKVGMILQAGGGSLAGRDGMGVVREYQSQQEDERRRAAIAGLLQQSGIGGVQRGLIEQLPVGEQAPVILNMLAQMEAQRRAGGAAGAAAARDAAAQEARMAQWQALTGGGQPQAAPGGFSLGESLTDVPAPSAPLSFGLPSAMLQAMPAPPTMPMSFGEIVPSAPPPPPSPYNMYRRALEQAYMAPPGTIDPEVIKGLEERMKFFAPPEPELTEAEREIARLTGIGIPYDVAVRIKEGVFQTIRDPLTGEAQVIDLATGRKIWGDQEAVAPAQSPAQSPVAETSAQPALTFGDEFGEAFADSNNAFGLEGFGRRMANTVLGVVPGMETPFPETQQTQTDFAVLQESLLNDIQSAYGRQPPSWLLQRIDQLTPKAGQPFESASAAQAKLRSLGRDIEGQIRSNEEALGRRLGINERQEVVARLTGLRSSLNKIRTVLNSFEAPAIRPDVADRLKAYE